MASSIPHAAPRQRSEVVSLAVYENHDADIPTNVGVFTPKDDNSTRTVSIHDINAELEKDVDIERGHVPSSQPSLKDEPILATESERPAEDEDPNIVFWDGPEDPENPMNWSAFRKWGTVAIISAITLLTPLASSMFAPGVPELMEDFNSTNNALSSFVVSVFVLGFAFGPLVFAPMSEMWGRLPLYMSCNVMFIVFTIACGLSTNIEMFIVFRFLQGTFGASPIALGGGTIADLIVRDQRGTAMAVWMMGPTIGPVIGPLAGGFVTQAKGWRWNFWIVAILSGGFTAASLIVLRETYAPAILNKKVRRLRKETGNSNLRSKLDTGLSPKDLFLYSIVRPTKMLFRSPIVFFTSLYMAIVYAYLYILFTTFTHVFITQYGFNQGTAGLSFLGLGIGCILAQIFGTYMSNRIFLDHVKKGDNKPEHRLPMMVPGGFAIPIGLFWYGWSVAGNVHWIMPQIGSAIIGIGIMWNFMPASTYLVDVFTVHAASAMAASTVIRSIFAAIIPLGGQKMYDKLGFGWGNSLLAFIAIAFLPVPFIFIRWGEYIRTRYTVKL